MAICFRTFVRSYGPRTYCRIRYQQKSALEKLLAENTSVSSAEVFQKNVIPRFKIKHENVLRIDSIHQPTCSEKFRRREILQKTLYMLDNHFYFDKLYLTCQMQNEVMLHAKECRAFEEEEPSKETVIPSLNRPDGYQLEKVHRKLSEDLPKIFNKKLDVDVYHQNLVFENNIRGTKTIGLKNYLKQISVLKFLARLKFFYVSFDVLKMTSHIEDGTIRVRWRIRGVSNLKFIYLFWQKNVVKQTEQAVNVDRWYDGFSIYYVKGDGLVHKHVVNKIIPNDSESVLSAKSRLAAKVALIISNTARNPNE